MTAHGTAAASPPRPLLRGVLHQAAFSVSLVVGTLLIASAGGGRASVAAAAFAGSAALMLGASSLYHRVTWKPRARLWMRRLDHAGIYLLIAGTYTAVGLLSLDGSLQVVVLAIVWAGAGVAILAKLCWIGSPKWLTVAIAISLGWVGVAAMPQVERNAGVPAVVLLASGGLAYTLGAIVYARRRPNPAPTIFGYHELFHALTIVALACQYVAIAFFVVKVG